MVDLIKLFFHKSPINIFLSINEKVCFPAKITKETNTTYAHVVKILKYFEESGLIEFNKQGRKKFINLTSRGKKIQNIMINLNTQLKDYTPNRQKSRGIC